MLSMNICIRRGDIYYADLSPVVGSEQGGRAGRFSLFRTTSGNKYSPTVTPPPLQARPARRVCLPTSPFRRTADCEELGHPARTDSDDRQAAPEGKNGPFGRPHDEAGQRGSVRILRSDRGDSRFLPGVSGGILARLAARWVLPISR